MSLSWPRRLRETWGLVGDNNVASHRNQGAPSRFAIKPLGDFTRTLNESVKIGQAVIVEGPYGCFDFGDVADDQVWVAGGVGISAFLARLGMLASIGGTKAEIHFFHSVSNEAESSFPDGLEDLCIQANVERHLRIADRGGRIKSADILPFVSAIGVWFCGPSRWASDLQSALRQRRDLPSGLFHRELFVFR